MKSVQPFATNGTKARSKRTNLDGFPPVEVDASRPVLDDGAPTERDEALHLERFHTERHAPYHFLRLRRRPRVRVHLPVVRLVTDDFDHGRLERALRVAREAYVDLVDGRSHQRVAILDEGRVKRVCLDGGGMRKRLPDCCDAKGASSCHIVTVDVGPANLHRSQ
jgi:hypothetical protein